MITNKQIEETANKFNKEVEHELDKRLVKKMTSGERFAFATSRTCGFTAGAHWAIEQFLKDLWHPISERPDNEALLVKLKSGRYFITLYSILVKEEGEIWCYLKDILPKQKGGEDNEGA